MLRLLLSHMAGFADQNLVSLLAAAVLAGSLSLPYENRFFGKQQNLPLFRMHNVNKSKHEVRITNYVQDH